MKAKAAIKGTVLKATEKYTWDIKWDDGIARAPYKSQQLKESSAGATDAPPASNTSITQGKFHVILWLVVKDLSSTHVLSLFCSALRKRRKQSNHHHHGGPCRG
jgi:hypothetical protein